MALCWRSPTLKGFDPSRNEDHTITLDLLHDPKRGDLSVTIGPTDPPGRIEMQVLKSPRITRGLIEDEQETEKVISVLQSL